jgi:hypothetical protein
MCFVILQAKAEYVSWLQRAAQEEARINALLEKRDRTYAYALTAGRFLVSLLMVFGFDVHRNYVDASLKGSNLPVRPHVIHSRDAAGSTAGAWLARQISSKLSGSC